MKSISLSHALLQTTTTLGVCTAVFALPSYHVQALSLATLSAPVSQISSPVPQTLDSQALDSQTNSVAQLDPDLPSLEPSRPSSVDSTPETPLLPATSIPTPPQELPSAASSGAWEETYVLGPGDQVLVSAFNAPEYSGETLVLSDGTISLPVTGHISVEGMTLATVTEAVTRQYAPYLREPRVSVSLTALRPVRVGVVGQVERPGTYTVPVGINGQVAFPTLTDAIQLAGGLSAKANLREIEVYRPDRFGNSQVLKVNLWNLLQLGDMSGDVLLRSGDTIAIPVAAELDPAEAAVIGSATFSPESMTVYVIGEVSRPGPVELAANTPLNQALLAAGGFDTTRADEEEILLVRLNEDGSAEERVVAVDLSADVNSETNPLLQESDVLVIGRSGLASFSDNVGLAVNPIGRLLSTVFNIFNIFD